MADFITPETLVGLVGLDADNLPDDWEQQVADHRKQRAGVSSKVMKTFRERLGDRSLERAK